GRRWGRCCSGYASCCEWTDCCQSQQSAETVIEVSMNPKLAQARAITRRTFFRQAGLSIGVVALGSLLEQDGFAAVNPSPARRGVPGYGPLAPRKPPFA